MLIVRFPILKMSTDKGNKPLSKAAARMKRKRDEESEADKNDRRHTNAVRTKLKRATETPDQTERRQNKEQNTH